MRDQTSDPPAEVAGTRWRRVRVSLSRSFRWMRLRRKSPSDAVAGVSNVVSSRDGSAHGDPAVLQCERQTETILLEDIGTVRQQFGVLKRVRLYPLACRQKLAHQHTTVAAKPA